MTCSVDGVMRNAYQILVGKQEREDDTSETKE
jgi:hypothetical protein